jgi:hypothetical protein
MVDLDKVKAWLAKTGEWDQSDPWTGEMEVAAIAHIEALVAEVERLRAAAKAVIDDFDRANEQRYDECKWGEFGGVGPLEDALGLHGKGSSPMIVVPGNKPAEGVQRTLHSMTADGDHNWIEVKPVEVREDDGGL